MFNLKCDVRSLPAALFVTTETEVKQLFHDEQREPVIFECRGSNSQGP